ncbi:germination protein KA [Sporosarcina sp. NCCP-2222]|uniref:spore germination protein n=1 Tax=Sporosarcina sp. NCCP-2222 TaxID=2935073 RepID=UPI00207DA63D|nr:spore germination protein [Sporosarcina sp. NCCP-2222]GKV57489.1 germination protein KA [Sporosarcina sp. NCCP-2222]
MKPNIEHVKKLVYETDDLFVKMIDWPFEEGIICYFTTLVDGGELNKQLALLKRQAEAKTQNWAISAASSSYPYTDDKLQNLLSLGETAIIFPNANIIVAINLKKEQARTTDEPENEHVITGSHEGFIENKDTNIALIRKRLLRADFVVKNLYTGNKNSDIVTYAYIATVADPQLVKMIDNKLSAISSDEFFTPGQLIEYMEEHTWSPFPQLLVTERPDRVASNLLEGRIVLLMDNSPTAILGPVTLFSFFQTPDDFNSRTLVGSFYRLLRIFSLITAIFLPAFYVSVVSFHSEILPIEISKQVKLAINEIPYRPFLEAFILEIFIELIREASMRLPTPIGQTIAIVGGLVVGDAIVSAGLVSNLMVIVVAMTAISSFVIPSAEMNMTIRILRFPFMLGAALFGFFGMVIGLLLLFIHLLNLRSMGRPYFSPVIPFDFTRFKDIFVRLPFLRFLRNGKKKGVRE